MAKDALFVFVHHKGGNSRRALLKQPGVKEVEEFVALPSWLMESTLERFCTFLHGYDTAFRGKSLLGLTQWLALKKEVRGLSGHWTVGLAKSARREAGRSASESKQVAAACVILKQFLSYRRRYGVEKLFADYNEWRRNHRARNA